MLLFPLLALSALAPLLILLLASVGREWFWPALVPARFDASAWAVFGSGRMAGAAVNSVILATATGVLAALIALPIGRSLSRLRGWARHLGAAAAFLPVAAPPVALAVGLQYSFLRLGLGGQLSGVLLAHLVPALGYAALFFLGIFTVWDERVEEEARSLGARPSQVFWRVTLPLLRRPLLEAFVLGFLVSWAQVPLTLLVGQGVVPTLAVEVLAYVQAGQDRFASAGALLLVVPPTLMLAGAGLAMRRAEAVAV